jgi:hypothetical protein
MWYLLNIIIFKYNKRVVVLQKSKTIKHVTFYKCGDLTCLVCDYKLLKFIAFGFFFLHVFLSGIILGIVSK